MRYTSRDPATGRWLGSVPAQTLGEAQAVLAAVNHRQSAWMGVPLVERLDVITGIAAALETHRDRLSEQVCLEVGKPLREAVAEVDKCVRLCHLVTEMAPGVLRQRHIRLDAVDAWIEPVPLGVLLAVMPWNYPLWQALRCIVPQLAAGNGVLLKPAPSVYRSSRAVVDVLLGVSETVPTDLVWTDNSDTVALIGTRVRGAVCVGARRPVGQGRVAGESLKKCVLELGNDAAVLDGADLEVAADTCMVAGRTAGRRLSAKRIVVEASVFEPFLALLADRVARARPGPWHDPAADLGPMARRPGYASRRRSKHRRRLSAGRVLVD